MEPRRKTISGISNSTHPLNLSVGRTVKRGHHLPQAEKMKKRHYYQNGCRKQSKSFQVSKTGNCRTYLTTGRNNGGRTHDGVVFLIGEKGLARTGRQVAKTRVRGCIRTNKRTARNHQTKHTRQAGTKGKKKKNR